MMRKLLALLVSSAVGLGGMSAASSAQTPVPQKTVPSSTTNATSKGDKVPVSPLPPGQAAGIKQAQGSGQTIWHIVGIGFIAGVGLAMIFIDGDDPSTPSTTN